MTIFTIGFTQTSAQHFFDRLKKAGVRRIVDIRISNVSQLAGFAKKDDLAYFARKLCGADYVHVPELAPTRELMEAYRGKKIDWDRFAPQFLKLLKQRNIAKTLDPALFDRAVLLCSEPAADRCHRSIVATHLAAAWGGAEIVDL